MKTTKFVGIVLLIIGSCIFVSYKAIEENKKYPLAQKDKVKAVKGAEPVAVNNIK